MSQVSGPFRCVSVCRGRSTPASYIHVSRVVVTTTLRTALHRLQRQMWGYFIPGLSSCRDRVVNDHDESFIKDNDKNINKHCGNC